jgi:hypothetical protein
MDENILGGTTKCHLRIFLKNVQLIFGFKNFILFIVIIIASM